MSLFVKIPSKVVIKFLPLKRIMSNVSSVIYASQYFIRSTENLRESIDLSLYRAGGET